MHAIYLLQYDTLQRGYLKLKLIDSGPYQRIYEGPASLSQDAN